VSVIPASVISDMDASMRSLGGRTVPDGAVGILPAFMMVDAGCHYVDFCCSQCSPAEFLWISLDGVGRCLLDLSYFPSDYQTDTGSGDQRMLCWV